VVPSLLYALCYSKAVRVSLRPGGTSVLGPLVVVPVVRWSFSPWPVSLQFRFPFSDLLRVRSVFDARRPGIAFAFIRTRQNCPCCLEIGAALCPLMSFGPERAHGLWIAAVSVGGRRFRSGFETVAS